MKKTITFFRLLPVMMLVLLLTGSGVKAWGQVSITALPQTYSQNFDAALGTSSLVWTNNSTVTGWYITSASPLAVNTGTTNANACYNFGIAGAGLLTDRALGAISTSTTHRFGLRMANNSGNTIGSFNINFTGEQWRSFNAGTLVFEYQVGTTVTSLTTGTWIALTTLDFASLTTSAGAATDGNNTSFRTSKSATLIVNVAANNEIFFRWTKAGSSSPGLAIDDLSITANIASSPSPTLTPASSPTVDAAFDVTFTEDASWRGAISAITVGGTTLDPSAYNKTAAGKITFTPSASTLLQSAGTKSIVIKATGYTDATVSQPIGAGVAAALTMKTQPAAPATNGATLATQPEVWVKDLYGNITTGTVVASKGDAGSWTLGGTTSVAAVSGVSTYTNLTATSAAAVTGAYLTFTLGSLTVNSATFNIAAPPAQIDWANLQWPASGTIKLGQAYDVFSQVYEPGVTDASGQGANVQVWIGYSTSNTDPSTWTNWVPATYGSDQGNNDEYKANLGAALSATGTYYYASRFQLGTGLYVYGGYNGGFWDGSTNVSGTLTVNPAETLDWVNLQWPSSGNITTTETFDVFAQVNESGLTPGEGQGAGIQAWIGYSTTNDNPATGTGWTWVLATYNPSVTGDNDEYKATISGLSAGTYYYASRFKYGLADYQYGGLSGSWVTDQSGVLTVTTAEPANHVTNFAASTVAPTYSSIKLDWTDASGAAGYLIKGSAVSYDAITAPADGTAEADGALVKNVAAGAGTFTFTGLTGETQYFFKIFPYNGTGSVINFKTDGTVPQASATTDAIPVVYRSKTTGDWNVAGTWEISTDGLISWTNASTTPGLNNSVFIQSGHTVTLTQNEACKDLNISTGTTSATSGSDAKIALATFTLEVSGKLRSYYAAIGTVPGTSSSTIPASPITITASSAGKIKLVGNSRIIATADEWGAGNTGSTTTYAIEFALNSGQTATMLTAIKASSWNIVSGILDAGIFRLAVDNGTEGEGNVTLANGATLISAATGTSTNAIMSRTGNSSTGEGGTFLLNGTLLLSGVAPEIAMKTLTLNGTVEYNGASEQNTLIATVTGAASPTTYSNLSINNSAGILLSTPLTTVTGTLLINSGKLLTLNAAKQLTVTGSLTNNGTLNLLSSVDGTATILTNGTVSGSGTNNVQQWLTVARQWWYLASPLTAAKTTTFTGANKIGDYNEATSSYSAPLATDLPLTAGKGYVVKLSDVTDGAYTFTGGTLNNGTIALIPTRTGTTAPKRGFNLIGNPYPSYLDWAAAYADATNPAVNMRNAIWYRTYAGGTMTFHTYGDGDAVPETTSPLIAPMQGFWVKVAADGSDGSLTFKNTHRKHFETGANPLKVKALDVRPRLRLVVSNGTATDEMLVVGKSYASDVLDSYDIEKMSNDNVAIPEVYSVVSNQELVINSMNALTEGKTVTLGFRPGQTGTYFTIEATQLENIDAKVMLLDKVAGTEQELTAGTPYSFEVTDATPTTDRFVISFAAKVPTGIETGSASGDMTVYTNRNNRIQVIYRGELNDQATVSVYNVAGQMLSTQKLVKNSTELSGTYRPGVYMIQLTDNGKKMTQKLIIK